MRTQRALRFTAVVALLLCAVPMFAARGTADFTRYVALGDSYTAGVENNSLVITHQVYSYPAVIARQTHAADFQQPLVSEPGIPPELALVGFTATGSPIIQQKSDTNGVPLNLTLPRPYNNLGIPGLRAPEALSITGRENPADTTAKQYAQFILRGLGTAADQAIAEHPTFITVWLGGYDALVGVLAGTPAASTPLATFTAGYTALLDKLIAGAPSAGIVVGSVPDVTYLPYATTIPPFVTLPNGTQFYFIADLGGGNIGQLPPGSMVTLGASSLLAQGYGTSPSKPLPDAVVLTPTEITALNQRAADINAAINSIAAARNIPVVDFKPTLEKLKTGMDMGGIPVSLSFLTGGFMSYDGFHPTDIGYTIIANEFLKTINLNYGTHFRQASLAPFFANNAAPATHPASIGNGFEFSRMAWEGILRFADVKPPADVQPPVRTRGIRRN